MERGSTKYRVHSTHYRVHSTEYTVRRGGKLLSTVHRRARGEQSCPDTEYQVLSTQYGGGKTAVHQGEPADGWCRQGENRSRAVFGIFELALLGKFRNCNTLVQKMPTAATGPQRVPGQGLAKVPAVEAVENSGGRQRWCKNRVRKSGNSSLTVMLISPRRQRLRWVYRKFRSPLFFGP